MKLNPDRVSLMCTVMTALIIVVSLLMINRLNRVSENFEVKDNNVNDVKNEEIKNGFRK